MARMRYVPRPTCAVFGTAFESTEEAWLWATRASRIASEGAKLAADLAVVRRPCEPRDLIGLVCRLRRRNMLNSAEMNALCAFGALDRPPDPRDPDEEMQDRYWQSGLDKLAAPLMRKGIVIVPEPPVPEPPARRHPETRQLKRNKT